MITKTLTVTHDLFTATPRIAAQLGHARFTTELLPRLRAIHTNLAQGPNPDLSIPLVAALDWGFHSPIQPVIETILAAQRFDWRFITGRPRRFKALEPGRVIPPDIASLWQKVLTQSTHCLTACDTP
ncbi:MAG: hypothetical protein HQL66_08240 [Magnetococcales bacterium]|nr:hypothetical protein [Magnetococcales bacterium]